MERCSLSLFTRRRERGVTVMKRGGGSRTSSICGGTEGLVLVQPASHSLSLSLFLSLSLCVLTRMFLSNAPSSFATGIALQRFAITGRRRVTRGGQSPHMWRQWFCFSRMCGIVFLPAQSGRGIRGDSGSSWPRSCRPSERRRMENRH